MKQSKKEFALNAIKPYFKNPDICGYDKEEQTCQYIAPNGNKCVAGQFMINPEGYSTRIDIILQDETQERIFVPEVVGILTNEEWLRLQNIHDKIANGGKSKEVRTRCERLGLFTYEELIA